MEPSNQERSSRDIRRQARELLRRARIDARALRREWAGKVGAVPRRKEQTLRVRLSGEAFDAIAKSAERSGRTISEEVRAVIGERYGVARPLDCPDCRARAEASAAKPVDAGT
jgi:hypothetical protein